LHLIGQDNRYHVLHSYHIIGDRKHLDDKGEYYDEWW
jgi:hypothetical protein